MKKQLWTIILTTLVVISSCKKEDENSDDNGFTFNGKFHQTSWVISSNWEYNGEYGTELYFLSNGFNWDSENEEMEGIGDQVGFDLITPNSQLVSGK